MVLFISSLSTVLFIFFQVNVNEAIEILMPENETDLFFAMSCRTERGFYLPLDIYRQDTCARCYFYLPPFAFHNDDARLRYDENTGLLVDPLTNQSHKADPENLTHPVYESFQSDLFARKWISCCRAALQCCRKMLSDPWHFDNDTLLCPRTWDGWQCWPDTPAGEVVQGLCQEHVYFRSEPPTCPKHAFKHCLDNGTWYVNERNKEWTNYSSCGRIEGMRRLQYFHIITYAISILFLLPALFIFAFYKQLQVYRITMHKNLFMALVLNALMCIAFKCFVILEEMDSPGNRITILEENGMGCKMLYVMTKYTRMTIYMWMFCEGFYLHKLIAASFAEQKSLKMFYFIGWVFPFFPVGTFALLRWYFADEECWAIPVDPYEWVTNSPNLLSLVLNFAFLCNIIRVLWTKLRATHINEPSQFRKAVRATLVLVPLFGLHFFFVLYRPPRSENCIALESYTFFNYSMDGLQGFVVSLIFCYLNGEVRDMMRESAQRMRLRYTLNEKRNSVQLPDLNPTHVKTPDQKDNVKGDYFSVVEVSDFF